MMRLNITLENGVNYEFIGSSRSTRGGFAHDCTMFINDYGARRATCQYINRTWENYNFQSVFITAICEELTAAREAIKRDFMRENNYKKLTAARRAAWLEECDKNARIAELKQIEKILATCGGCSVNLAETKTA